MRRWWRWSWWRWWLHSATMSIYLCHFMHMQSMQFACAGADIYIHNCIGSCQQETRSIWYFWNAVAFWEDLRFCICAGRLGALLMLLLVRPYNGIKNFNPGIFRDGILPNPGIPGFSNFFDPGILGKTFGIFIFTLFACQIGSFFQSLSSPLSSPFALHFCHSSLE